MANPLLTDEQNRRLANQNSTYNQIMQGFAPVQQPQEDSWLGGLSRGAKAVLGGVGAGLLHAGQAAFGTDGSLAAGFDAMAKNNAQRREWDLADTLSLDYLTNPEGLAYGLGQIAGSMALPALFGAGVAAAVPTGGTSLLGTGALIGAAGAAPMAISEGGNTYAQGLQQGMTEDEAKKAGLTDAAIKLPFYMLSEGLSGKVAQGLISKGLLNAEGKSLGRRAAESGAKILGNAANEAYEEGTENRSSAYALGDQRISSLGNIFNPFDWNEEDKAQAVGVFTPTLALGALTGGAGHLRSRFDKKNSDVAEEIASEDGGTIEEAPNEENFWENKEAAKHSIQQAYADGLISKDDARVMLMKINDEELGEADKKRLKAREKQVAAAIESRRIQGYNDELDNYVNNYESGKEAFINAIGGQESGGDYGAVNGRTGASGKYQIMPENWSAWAEEAGIGADAEMTPENQEIVARYKLGEYYDKYGARGAAIAWYAGEGALDYSEEALNRKQGNGDEPSINEYADSVLARMGNYADNARIDDTEENYFDESDSMGLPKLSAPTAKGFDVSHLIDEEAQDARELFGKKQDENIGKQNLGNDFFSNIKVEQDKRAKAIKDIARAVSQPNTFDELRNSIPSNYLEQMQKVRAVVPINNNAVGRPIPLQTGAALTMQRGRNGGLNTDELAIMQKYQGNPDAFNRQFEKSVEAVRDAVNRGDITPDVGRAYMQNLGNMYNTVVGTVQNDGVILQGQDPAIIKMLGNLRDKRRRGDTGVFPSLLQENGNADRSAAFANRNNPLAPLNLPVRTQKEWDKAEAEYKARTEEKSEKHTRQQTIADIVNARAAQKWDKAEAEYVSTVEKGIDIALPKGVTVDAKSVKNKKTGKKEVELRFSGEKISDEFKKKLIAHGFNWNVGRKAWVAEENIVTKAVAEKLTQKDNGEVKNGKEETERIDKTEEKRGAEGDTGETKNSEAEQAEAEHVPESNQDEVNKKAVSVEENIANGQKAIERIIETHEDIENAMYRDDTGNIDFVWGREGTGAKFKHGYGLAHIIAKRNSENGNGIETAKKLVEVIAKGTKVERQESQNGDGEARLKIHYDGYTAVLSLSRDKNTWLLTGWEDNDAGSKKATVNASGEGYDSTTATTATPTLTRRNGETVASVTKSVAQPAENVKKINLPKGTTVDVSIVGDNSNIIQVKFNGAQGKGTGGIMGRAGYKWKNDKQVWQARKTEKAMDVAEQLGYKPAEEAKPQERDYELERDELWDTFATKLGIDNILSVDKANEELKGVEGLHDGAVVYYDNNNRLYHIISKESDPEMLKLGYNYDVRTFDVHHMPISVGAVKTADEVIKRVTGRSEQKAEPKAKPSADTFSKNPDALVKGDKISSMPLSAMKFIKDMFDKGEARQNAKDAIRIALFKSKDLEASARNNTYDNFKIAYFDAAENYLADNVDNNPAYAKLLESGSFAKENMERAAKETYNLFRVGMEKQAESKPAEKQENKEPAKRFDGERARKSLDALIGRKKKSEPQKNDVVPKSKFMNVFNEDELDSEIEKAKKEMSKLSANPMFNPALMKSLFKIGGIYLQKGVNKFAAWADNMVDVMGEKVRPFLPAVWDSLKKYPDNQKFNDDVMTAVMEYVGEGVDNGKSLSAIKREFADDYGDEYIGYVDAAFEGVKKYPTSDNVADVVESKQDNTEGGKENGTDGQTIQTGDSSGSGAVRRGVSSAGKAVHAGGRGSERPDSLLGREPSEDGGTSEETGNSSRVRDREHNQSGRPVGKESEFGNVHNGRKGERSAEQTDVAGSVGRRSRGTDGGRTGVTTNYHIEDPDALIGGTPKVRFLRNKKAIEVVQELLDNERPATKEERDAMAAYIGWGSFGQELFQGTWEKPIYKDGWKEENDWLRDTLGKDAWEEAQNSIINAHYTDPYTINSMWKMAKNMGFKGGKVLEPSMGVGNFFGLMPKGIAEKSQLTGIELDRTTGRMAQALYPQANIQIKGYEESRTPDNFYDMIIGNVPFGNFNIADRRYGKLKPLIHDFFFLKGIDQLKPGGIMMAITTKGTLDKADARVRMELAKKADLVAAYRLPTGAFDKYAGTNVVTDILIFKKIDKPRTGVRELEWVNSSKYQTTFRGQQETYYYNDYFKNHPENVLGIMEFGHGTTTGRPGLTVKRLDDFGERLKEIPNEVPKNIFEADKAQDNIQYISNHKGGEQGSVTAENGKLYTVYGDQLKPLADTKKYSVKSDKQTAQRIQEINDWIKLRDTLGALYDAERTDAANMEELRAELNKVFDDYCAKYVKQGKWERKDKDDQPPFRQSYVNKYMKSIEEPSAARVMALVDDNGNTTAIFSKRSVRGSNTDIKNPTISQALIMQRNENVSNLDIDRIAELAKKSKADVISELTKSGTIFKTPAGNYEVKDVYLSGNVRQKLREAEDALQSGDKDMQANIEALKKVIPETVPYYNISTSMGATWIPQDVYRQFIAHLLSLDSIDNIKLTRTKGYSVELGKGYNNLNAATAVYGLSEIPFSKLLTHAFNHTKPVITMRKSGEVVEDTEAMNKANDKLEKIYDEFNDWLWKDNSRKLQLEHEYNEIMNAIAVPTYDGSFMDMPGMALLRGNSQFNLRQHQLNAIYRGLINGSGVYAHEVGTGKTYTMAGLAIESRRYGLAKKPLLLAFNANSASVAKEINDMYPGAKVLYIDNLDRKNIKLKLEQIRTDDWDCVVMPHSLVDKLSFKEDTLMAMAEQQIYELEQAAIEAAEQDGEKISVEQMEKMRTAGKDEKVKGVRSTTAKKLVTMRNKIINQIKQSALNASAEDAISFEDLGIDMVLVDEAHAFKKPPFATTRKIKGLTTESSNRSIQLSFITQYIQSINNGRGVHLFTGTPITNTLTEMYHMMRYVMPKAMEDAGIKEFDSWMNSFAEETADMEFTSTGDVEMVSRLASFTNVPELRRFVGQYWDTVFADDMPEFKPRETASGKTITDKLTDEEQDELLNGYTEEPQGRPYKKVIVETLKLTNSQNTILNDLVKKAKRYKDATKQERKKIARQEFHATPLLISNDASLAGMDPRLYDININTQGEETKIDRCVNNVAKIYKEGTDAHPTVQVIFTDVGYSDTKTRSIPQRTGFGAGDFKSVKETVPTFNMAKALVKQLTEQGIPENEIVVMKASYSPEKRAQIADMLKTGKYRVVIGSTATLGVGVNMQDNLRAMHHLDCPWMPGDLTQRNGRGHRQGNHWNTVLEYRYVTEKLDTKRWQTVLRKDAFINSFMKSKVGDNSVRAFEMGADDMNDKDTDSDLLQTLSEASGDPRVLIQKKYETNLAKLERKERTFIAGIEDIKGRLKYIDSVIEHKKDEWNALSADAETFVANKKADFEIKLVSSLKVGASRKLVTFDNRTDAQKHLGDILKQVMDIGVDNRIGEYTGFEVVVRKEASSIDGTYQPAIRLNGETTHLCGTPSIGGIASKAANIPGRVGKAQTAYEQAKKDKAELQKAAQETFPQQKQLDKTRKQLEEVKQDRMLSPTPPPEWLVNGVTLSSTFYVDDKPYSLSGYRANSDGYYLVGEANGEQRVFPFQDATDIQGMKVYDMTNHVPSPAYKAPSAEDIKNATANNTQYSVSSEAVQRAKEEVEAEIRAAFPNGKVEYVNGVPTITMPNGSKFQYSIRENIVVNAKEQRKADAAHGTSGARVQGYWKKFTGNGVQRMLAVSQSSERGTAFHEAMHAAIDLVLTEKEKNALYNYYEKKAKEQNRDVDEVIADAYRDWVLARQRKSGTMFGKLWRKVKDFCTRVKAIFDKGAEVERIMQDIESGRVYERGTSNHSVTKRIFFSKEEIQGQKGSGTTQVATTRTMYVKALKWLRNQSPEAKTVLDYGAGLGLGTDDMRSNNPDLAIDSYEPNPERWAGKQPPTYTNNTQIDKDYDLILNTNVLNVVEKPIRDLIVKDIADHLNVGGKALITTRGWSNDVNAAKNFKPADEHHAIWINKGKNGYVFQKGFDGDELKNYIEELLGDEFVVEKTRPTFGKSSVTITRVKAQPNTSAKQLELLDMESYQEMPDSYKTLKGSVVKRSKYGVGKQMGSQVYLHKDYVSDVIPKKVWENALKVLSDADSDFEYNCVMYDTKTGNVRFDEAPDFDESREPIVGDTITVKPDGTVKRGHSNYIWHHKWLWVKNDYQGFDVNQSKAWSNKWLGTLTETADGNGIERWNAQLDRFNLERDGEEVHYSVASPKHKIANAFTNTERKGVVDSVKDFFTEHRKSLYQDWFDKNNPLKGFDALTKATGGLSVYDQVQSLPATTAGMLKALTEGTAQHVKMANQHLKNVKMKYNVTLAMALEKIDKKQMDKAYPKYLAENGFDNWVNALGAYLGAERCLEMARLARAEGKTYKFPKGLTEQECQEFVKKAPQQFKAAADIFYKVNDNVISIMEDAEVFSHDLAKTLRTKYRKYCPLLRDFSDTAAADSFIGGLTEGGRGIGNVSVPLKRINIEGSERGVLNPLETILKSYAVMLNRAERNKVALMAVENSRTADLHELIQEVPGTTADPKNCVFTVLIKGKKKAYKTTQDLYGPIVGYNLPAANLAFGVARTAARMLRTGATMSPSFILRNVLRDTVFAGISSKNGFIPIVDTIRGAIALAKDPAMRAEFEAAGVTEYNFYSSQKSRIKSLDAMAGETPASAWEIIKAVFSRLEATSDFFESSTRMGEYMKARQKGLSMEEAARAAREVTLDFSRSGRIGEQVNQVVPFFNACLQGGDKMVRLFREDFVGTSQKVFKYIVLPSLLIMAMNWDEDWYKDLDPDVKNNYWCLGRNIRIPKPQEAGVLFGSGIEALFQQAADKDKDAVSNFLKAFSSNMMPSVLPTLILPLIEWSANYSFFKGRPLVGNKYSRLPDELQYNDYTSELSKGIGSALKVSPMKIDNLVRGYTGTMGALLWSMAGEPFAKANNLPAKHFSELPFVRDFNVTDANLSRPMNEFYGILDKANRQHAGYGVKGKPEAAVKGIRSAGSMISKIRKDIDKITHSNLTPERKRELIDKRKEKMNQIAKQANARYGKYFD